MSAYVVDNALDPVAIGSAEAAEVLPKLSGPEAAGAAIAAGDLKLTEAAGPLMALLDDDGLAGRCAAWALGQIGDEAALVSAAGDGGLDQRENAYRALAILAALGRGSGGLADATVTLVQGEVARAKDGRTGLGEKASLILAILGDERTDAMIQEIITSDPYTDRFELQRQRKAVSEGRDGDSIDELTASWTALFADDLYVAPEPVEEVEPEVMEAELASAAAPEASEPAPQAPAPQAPESELEPMEPGEEEDMPEAQPAAVNWEAFISSEAAAELDPTMQQLVAQLGPALEQLATRAVGVGLSQLTAEECAAVLLQVLPQALPQQHAQAALSPEALNSYQKLGQWIAAQDGVASNGFVDGIKLVRRHLREQVRSTGMLGGPDYSDPDGDDGDEEPAQG